MEDMVKKWVPGFLEFFPFSHGKLHNFSRFSREIKNREKCNAYSGSKLINSVDEVYVYLKNGM